MSLSRLSYNRRQYSYVHLSLFPEEDLELHVNLKNEKYCTITSSLSIFPQ
uniref:Uncharacterized protein n=1 Tax=Arundo donax TaxID=35708 RepID=A0A0A8Y7X5_ARUDO